MGFPLKNFSRSLSRSQIDANQAGALYSERVFGLGDNCEMCTPNDRIFDEYGRVVGVAGVRNSGLNACNKGVFSSEYRMNIETATRPYITDYNINESFDALRLGRDVKDLGLSRLVQCGGMPHGRQLPRGSIVKRRIN